MKNDTETKPFIALREGDVLLAINYCITSGLPTVRLLFKRHKEKKVVYQDIRANSNGNETLWLESVRQLNPFNYLGASVERITIGFGTPLTLDIFFSNKNKLQIDLQNYFEEL